MAQGRDISIWSGYRRRIIAINSRSRVCHRLSAKGFASDKLLQHSYVPCLRVPVAHYAGAAPHTCGGWPHRTCTGRDLTLSVKAGAGVLTGPAQGYVVEKQTLRANMQWKHLAVISQKTMPVDL